MYQIKTDTQKEQKDRHVKMFMASEKTRMTVSTYSKEDNNLWVLDGKEIEVVKTRDLDFLKSWSTKYTKCHL